MGGGSRVCNNRGARDQGAPRGTAGFSDSGTIKAPRRLLTVGHWWSRIAAALLLVKVSSFYIGHRLSIVKCAFVLVTRAA